MRTCKKGESRPQFGHGTVAWAALAAYVVLYDTWALARGTETLSAAFARALARPRTRWPLLALWGVTTLHLVGRLPVRYDPFHRYANILATFGEKKKILALRVLPE